MRTLLTTLLIVVAGLASAQEPTPSTAVEPAAVELPTPPELMLYPNPTSDVLRVRWGTRSLLRMPIEVRGLDGRLVLLDQLGAQNELNVSQLDDGFYRLLLMDLSGVRAQAVFKVVK